MRDFVIDGIWLLRRYSGVCIFEENYVDFKKSGVSRDLVTGFLTAIVSFADEAFKDKLEFIKFSNHKIVFRFTKHVFFIIAVSSDFMDSPEIETHINQSIEKIISAFLEEYGSIFERDNWNGNIDLFKNFSKLLREIVKRKPLDVKLILLEKTRRKKEKKEARRTRRKKELERLS